MTNITIAILLLGIAALVAWFGQPILPKSQRRGWLLEEKVAVGGPSFYFVRRPNMFGSPNPHGLITLSDISALRREQWGFTPVERLMTNWNQLSTTDPSDSLNDALSKMESQGVSQLPVVEDGTMVGVLSRSGVMSHINNQ